MALRKLLCLMFCLLVMGIGLVSSQVRAESTSLPKLIDLGADKCIPCKMMMPILDELKEQLAGQLDVEFIDVWKNRDRAAEFAVQMIPTQIFYGPDGKELFRHQGFYAKEDILAKWQELGFDFDKK